MYLQVLIDPASWLCLDEVHDVEQNGSTVRHIASDEKMICSNLFLGIRRRSAHACPCVFTWMIIVNDETSLINLIATIIEASPLRYNAQKSKIDFCMYMLFYSDSIRLHTHVLNTSSILIFFTSRKSTHFLLVSFLAWYCVVGSSKL